ncbi:MAG: GntR family transcriptional regulator [Anaerovoracaceae bacterium]|jgi:DNA-binding GntR family transcriptional regulator
MPIVNRSLNGVISENVSLSTDLLVRLKGDILSGRLKDGQKLTEKVLCEQYGVSRTPVREALVQLQAEGLVTNIPNRGAFVTGLSERDLDDMYTLRKIYEMQAVKWAMERMTDEEADELEETFEFMEFYTMKHDVDKMLNINLNFHQIIYKASHNRMLRNLLSSYQVYTKYAAAPKHDERYLDTVLEEHRHIYEAFKARDSEAGEKAMAEHMDNSYKRHLMALGK